jgi:hypothetical protein
MIKKREKQRANSFDNMENIVIKKGENGKFLSLSLSKQFKSEKKRG